MSKKVITNLFLKLLRTVVNNYSRLYELFGLRGCGCYANKI
jgi:hypothetical protein